MWGVWGVWEVWEVWEEIKKYISSTIMGVAQLNNLVIVAKSGSLWQKKY